MKLNWGHKIAIVYTLFAGFMVFMVILSMQEDHELVTEDYYQQEKMVQTRIDGNANLNASPMELDILSREGNILLAFKGLGESELLEGKVNLYKPDNAALDESHPLIIDENAEMHILPKGSAGLYRVSVSFEINGATFYKTKDISL
ncbi:MAG: FixH family protein [Cryomorphaceae bacterium]|nr:FixH family protein [Flavobacteriales bacterium]